eukprot:gnl/TRDRNA2_/TRDRNA2_199379_c0_seq1.p1 gnl/TRDRNA2_/TRDRNA2_199379_c0~~gnl/TRDRNA2_/TRDRNA2_199379_c0_seq1.p1  ORF type:complete len:529 (-),score=91.30 gnl/TRDRNA2_/TRDRNA2_199379_c0_seq1:56-1642(-)
MAPSCCRSQRRTAGTYGDVGSLLPSNAWRILATEFGERFSYYGLRAVLTLYFVSIGFTEDRAVSLFAYTAALAYLTPLFGGAVADIVLGRYRTILVFSLIYVIGSVALAVSAALEGGGSGALVALGLISIGTGGIKPCVSAFGADQLSEGGEAARARYFAGFYLAINAGSVLSFVVAPLLRSYLGFSAAFGATAIVLALAVAIFVAGRGAYRHSPPGGLSLYAAVAAHACRRDTRLLETSRGAELAEGLPPEVLGSIKVCKIDTDSPDGYPQLEIVGGLDSDNEDSAATRSSYTSPYASEGLVERAAETVAALRRLVPILLLMPCFWALFDQQGSAWVLQARAMRRDGLLPFGWEMSPEAFQIFNPIFVLLLVPIMTRIFEAWPELTGGRFSAPRPLQKMGVGMFVAAAAFLSSAFVQARVDAAPASSVTILWQLPQFFLITLAEVLVSVVSLDYFYAEAPRDAKAAVSALALLMVSAGNLLCGLLYQIFAPRLSPVEMLLAFAGMMAVNATMFCVVAYGRQAGHSEG